MMASLSESHCSCSIASARFMLEQAGFTVSETSLYGGSRQTAEERDEMFTLYCSTVAVLVLVAGLMSGLTLGLMSLDTLDLEVLRRSGTAQEQKYAKAIEPVRASIRAAQMKSLLSNTCRAETRHAMQVIRRPHWLLVTLVLVNAAATEALPLFLDRLADPITAVLVSVVVVLIFGEIIPQAVCSRHGLAVGAHSAWFVRILMWAFAIIAYPISRVLDYLLGQGHTALFRRAQLKALVDAHGLKEGLGGNLSHDEVTVIRGALDLTHKTAADCMTPMDKVFMLPSDTVLEETTLGKIISSGHSRVPIYHPDNRHKVIGLILVKELAMVDKAAHTPVSTLKMRSLPFLRASTPLYDLLHLFEVGRCHMAVLTGPLPAKDAECSPDMAANAPSAEGLQQPGSDHVHAQWLGQQQQQDQQHQLLHDGQGHGKCWQPESATSPAHLISTEHHGLVLDQDTEGHDRGASSQAPVGIITLEDCLEELIQQEIVDETDCYIDNEQRQRVNAQLMLRNLPPRLRKMMLSRQFHPRIGALAAVSMNRRQVDAHNPLQQPLLLHQRSADAPTTQVSAVAGQRLLSAMDMLKPILADSPEKQPDSSLRHGMARSAAGASKPNSRRTSETGSVSYIV